MTTVNRSAAAKKAWRTRRKRESSRRSKKSNGQKYRFAGKALTFRQPHASAIAFGGKDIENRCWRTHYRGPLAIHAGGAFLRDLLDDMVRQKRGGERRTLEQWITRGRRRYDYPDNRVDEIPTSHIIAIAMVVDCVERSSSPWYGGEFGFVLDGVIPIQPIPRKGKLGLWDCRFSYTLLSR